MSINQWRIGMKGPSKQALYGIPASEVSTTDNILVANRFQIPTIDVSIPDLFTSRRSHYASPEGDISALRCVDFGYFISDSFVMGAAGSTGVSYTIKRYIEYPAGVFNQVTWGGATTKAIGFGGAVYTSDPVTVVIPAGAKFWVRTVNVSGAARNIPCAETPAGATVLGLDDGNSASDLGNSGVIAATSGANTFGPIAIIGTVAKANARAFVAFGDSITWGYGDITSAGSRGGSGWIARGLDPLYPYIKVAKNSIRADQIRDLTVSMTNLLAAIGFTDTIIALGTNDLSQGVGTPSSILTAEQSIYTNWCTGKRLYLNTLMSRSLTTDAYATVVNQTMKSDGNWSQSTALNGLIRAGAIGAVNYIESADASMSARNSGVWQAPPAQTTDGTHPNSTSAAAISAAIASGVSLTPVTPALLWGSDQLLWGADRLVWN